MSTQAKNFTCQLCNAQVSELYWFFSDKATSQKPPVVRLQGCATCKADLEMSLKHVKDSGDPW